MVADIDIQIAGSWPIDILVSSSYLMSRHINQCLWYLVQTVVLPVAYAWFQSPFSSGPFGPWRHWFPQLLSQTHGHCSTWFLILLHYWDLGQLDVCWWFVTDTPTLLTHSHTHPLFSLAHDFLWPMTCGFTAITGAQTPIHSHVHRTESLHPGKWKWSLIRKWEKVCCSGIGNYQTLLNQPQFTGGQSLSTPFTSIFPHFPFPYPFLSLPLVPDLNFPS